MKLTTTLEEVQYAASICLKCGCCTYSDWPENHAICPLYSRDECFVHGGGGFMSIVAALAEGLATMDEKIAGLAYACSGCLGCDSRCTVIKAHPPQVDMIDMIRLLRYEAVKKGLVPDGFVRQYLDKAHGAGDNEYGGTLSLPESVQDDHAETAIFMPCSFFRESDGNAAALSDLLEKIGTPVAAYQEAGGDGAMLYDLGMLDQLSEKINANWEKMKASDHKTFVFTDPHSQEFIAKRYPENIPESSDIRTQHVSQFILDAMQSGKLKSRKSDKVSVSYHDPCYLGRGLGVYDAPREVLTRLEGVSLLEMKRNKKAALCCGARSSGDYFPGQDDYVAGQRLEEFGKTGADLLITACPYCKTQFQKILPEKEKKSVMDLTEFVNHRV